MTILYKICKIFVYKKYILIQYYKRKYCLLYFESKLLPTILRPREFAENIIVHVANRGLTRFTRRPDGYPISNYADCPEISGGYSYGYMVTPYVTRRSLALLPMRAR